MTTSIKYNLEDFHKISFHGFNFTIPEHTINLISSLAMEVGSPTYIKTPVFQKKDIQKKKKLIVQEDDEDIEVMLVSKEEAKNIISSNEKILSKYCHFL